VLDPEPSLLDSNFVEPSKLQLLFCPSGKYAASTHFIHIRAVQLLHTPDLIFNQYHLYIEWWPEPFCTQVEEVAEISRSCLADKTNDFVNFLDALPQHIVITCDKHFLDLVALGMSTAALTLSTFNSAHISTLESHIVSNNKRFDHLLDIPIYLRTISRPWSKIVTKFCDKLAALLKNNKVHFTKMTDFMEQKFGTAVTISECFIDI